MTRARAAAMAVVAVAVFAVSWLFRFNDPGGAFAGLTDDHFFYVVRGWQILYGDLPVRDFADHGAPLYYYVAWAVQRLFGRGTLSEVALSAAALSAGAALTFWLAARASGSIVFGLAGALFEILLEPRFYNYPKILVYAAAIPLLWAFVDRPTAWRRAAVAVGIVAAFLLRHDHGVYVAIAMAALLAMMRWLPWRDRLRHAVACALIALALLSPYLVFIQANGGLLSYFGDASAWAGRDRERASLHLPDPFAAAAVTPPGSSVLTRTVASVNANIVAWTFYVELTLPLVALAMLAMTGGGRARWPHAMEKIAIVAVLGLVLDAGFLRSPIEARLADPSVPHAILLAWLGATMVRVLWSAEVPRPALRPRAWLARAATLAAGLPLLFLVACGMTKDLPRRLEKARMDTGVGDAIDRAGVVARELRQEWETLPPPADGSSLVEVARYLRACTMPSDRVFVDAYVPQVTALGQRAFAGGHADLRAGLFDSERAQRLTVSRLEKQSVPVILLDASDAFRGDFPLVTAYVDRHYTVAGTRSFSGGYRLNLLVNRDAVPRGTYEALGWPCFGSGSAGGS